MKKTTAISIALLLVLFSFISCGKGEKATTPKAGSATPDDMLSLLPMNAKGVFFVNVNQAMSLEAAEKAIKEHENYKELEEFIEMTGIDPLKDIYYAAIALTGDLGKKEEKGVAVINLKYDKEKIVTLMKEKAAEEEDVEIRETEYSGLTVYAVDEEDDEDISFTFLDNSNIVAGKDADVKTVIDISQKKADNIYKNQALSELLAKTNKDTLFWGAILIPAGAVDEATADNPMLSNLKDLKAATMNFDYKNMNVIAEIKLISTNAEKNEQIAKMLDGLKAMGGMMATEKPEIGELLSKIEISSSPEHVKIYASLPQDLLDKLKESIPHEAESEL
ncbi:DUF3352 domain-containing protein [Acidobacteriota bacterium]